MASREERVLIFKDSIQRCMEHEVLTKAIARSIQKQCCYWQEDEIPLPDAAKYEVPAKLVLTAKRSFEAAQPYAKKGQRVAVLNFASSVTPGGGVMRGAGAQEESLCRISTLYPALIDSATAGAFYNKHWDLIHGGKMGRENRDDCIYTPGVIVFKADDFACSPLPEEDWYTIDVITCAAPDLRFAFDGTAFRPTADALYELFVRRISHILAVAATNNVEVLILGAFGCGAFGNDPALVSKAFEQAMGAFHQSFTDLVFAIPYTPNPVGNYQAFSKIAGLTVEALTE